MSIQRAEELKRIWTDQWIQVVRGIPELRRFEGLTGQVRTVNMNGRLLVQFETSADIAWYDIDPDYVEVIERPAESSVTKTATETSTPSSAKAGSAGSSADQSSSTPPKRSKPTSSGSPLDQIRQQAGATQAASVTNRSASPLDLIRKQQSAAANTASSTSKASAPEGSPNVAPTAASSRTAESVSPSPLDLIRRGAAASPPKTEAKTALSPLEQIRAAQKHAAAATDAFSGSASSAAAQVEVVETSSGKETAVTGSESTSGSTSSDSGPSSGSVPGIEPVSERHSSTPAPPFDTNPIAQIRRQAGFDAGEDSTDPGAIVSDVFERVRRQAENSPSQKSADEILGAASETDAASPMIAAVSTDADSAATVPQPLFENPPQEPAASLTSSDSSAADSSSAESDHQSNPEHAEVSGTEDPVRVTFRGKQLPRKDDLKIVEGIGPRIAELFNENGIQTWLQLSNTSPDRLREILTEAGPRFRMHNPDTWPNQALLAAEGRWQELEDYQDHLTGGRETSTES